ncbi:MAG: AmmeMemoRadiSam system protein B [Candidatus Omnitrophica bacterium]|nr:AmmeMemoRadiSam system protein B [Candidatus Omnitrophota bacterium]MBU1996899.1 AmmeMemoRadiSam system protein B [Candidatus Omnitrophota bacterium]MBU4334190.1 AmmeMemoRadiSam system protein B [Candidatus Omnitrophota bacterium]
MNIKRVINLLSLTLLTLVIIPKMSISDQKIKNPNVSGQFYDSRSERLSKDIDKFLLDAKVTQREKFIDIIISPHAGYIYSGAVAAHGFKAASKNKYKTVVILAPSHFHGFDGVSIGLYDAFKTPLGDVPVDLDFAKKLELLNDKFYFDEKAFAREHSLEVQIPFIQKTFNNFKVVPVVVGQISAQTLKDFAQALNVVIGNRKDVLVVASTDLSHYHDAEFARNIDRKTIEVIKSLDVQELVEGSYLKTLELCGSMPVAISMVYAKLKGLTNVEVLTYANSGDVSGDRSNVVGYVSAIIYGDRGIAESSIEENVGLKEGGADQDGLSVDQKKRLLFIARKTVEEYVRNKKKLDFAENDARLKQPEGAFVTLKKNGKLRGCIGNIIAQGPLYLTVRNMAIAAASQDHRFSPVTVKELDDIEIDISVLTKPRVVKSASEIVLGKHGVIVSRGSFNQGVFLPQVATDTGWSKEKFLSELCSQKAQLPPDSWKDPATKLEVFEAIVFDEHELNDK